MSIVKIEIKEDHFKLLKALKWSVTENKFLVSAEDIKEDPAPFGEDNKYAAMDLILNGRDVNADPLSDELKEYSEEEIKAFDELFNELPLALEIILYTSSFEVGTYRCKYHDRQWKKLS